MAMSLMQARKIRDGAQTECREALGSLQATIEHVAKIVANLNTIAAGGITTEPVTRCRGQAAMISDNLETTRQRLVGLSTAMKDI